MALLNISLHLSCFLEPCLKRSLAFPPWHLSEVSSVPGSSNSLDTEDLEHTNSPHFYLRFPHWSEWSLRHVLTSRKHLLVGQLSTSNSLAGGGRDTVAAEGETAQAVYMDLWNSSPHPQLVEKHKKASLPWEHLCHLAIQPLPGTIFPTHTSDLMLIPGWQS